MNEEVVKYLRQFGIKPTYQRVAVMEYLMSTRSHPTTDEIVNALIPNIEGLSRRTIYNTVDLLADRGAVLELDIDRGRVRYDAYTNDHCHMVCEQCGQVFDIAADGYLEEVFKSELPEGFTPRDVQIVFRVICDKCNKKLSRIQNSAN